MAVLALAASNRNDSRNKRVREVQGSREAYQGGPTRTLRGWPDAIDANHNSPTDNNTMPVTVFSYEGPVLST
jgi:hypothetical protein